MKCLNKLGYTKAEILVIVLLLGVVAFITISQTSYAFALDDSKALKEIKNLIEIQAEDYAVDNLNIFSEESNTTFILVNDLVEANYLIGNNSGLVTNPSDSSKNFNDNRIKLEYNKEQNTVTATLID